MYASQPLQAFFILASPEKLYHYTGVGALLGIADKREIWATHIYYLNDSKELLHAVEFLQKVMSEMMVHSVEDEKANFADKFNEWLRHLQGTPFDLFVFSLSEQPNLLSQWRSYTPHGKGVSIEFPERTVRALMELNGLKLGKCAYTDSEHSDLLLSLFEFIWGQYQEREIKPTTTHHFREFFDSLRVSILEALALVKHGAFSEEREWRLIQCSEHTHGPIFFRESPTMLVPFTKLQLGEQRRPFGTIQMGPSENPNLALASLRRLVGDQQLSNAIMASSIPYRKW